MVRVEGLNAKLTIFTLTFVGVGVFETEVLGVGVGVTVAVGTGVLVGVPIFKSFVAVAVSSGTPMELLLKTR